MRRITGPQSRLDHGAKEASMDAQAFWSVLKTRGLTFISGARDDMLRDEYEHFLDPQVQKQCRRIIEYRVGCRDFCDAPTWERQTFEDDVDWELERLKSVGIGQVIIVNLTKPEFGIPVVRVIIPGLEGSDHSPKCVLGARARARLQAVA